MPLQWTSSHTKPLVVAGAKGEMRPRAMVDFVAALVEAGARRYAKLVFLEQLITTFNEESVAALANLGGARNVVGLIAIVAPDDATFE